MKIPMALWPRLMPLLDEALALPPEQREAWLRAQTLDDEMLAALRQLLADREELDGGAFMAELPKLDPVAPLPHPDADAPEARSNRVSQSGLFAGDMLGPYRLIKPLGQGGMSVVWLAERDDGQIRRQVALKMPHAGPGQALLAERLRRERDILASLEHRHIARLYDVGTAPTGLPFMVLEYIEGQPLPVYCDEHHLTLHERLQLFLQVLSAVQYAHTKLVLHRDLKPSNILVNGQGEVKLLDFGIAKLIRDSETGPVAPSTELTQHNGHVLTPDYAAPEQIAGEALTTASDVYALGVILFELLTGQRPYRLPRGTRGALEEAILAADARRPSQVWLDGEVQTHHPTAVTVSDLAEHFKASPRRLSQQLRGDLDVIVATALQKQAARRYATAEAFAQDIQHHLAKEPIAAQPDSRWYRTRKYVQRHAWALGAVGAVVAALSVGLGVALWQAKEARQEAAKANAIKDFLVGLFENGDVEQPDALRKRQQTVEQLLVNSANALGTQLKDQPEVRVELQGVVGGLLHNLAITDEAIKLRKQRVAQLEAMGAPVAERAQALRELADSQDARGDALSAKSSTERGLALCRSVNMTPRDVCYGLQINLGHLALIERNIDLAQKLIDFALDRLAGPSPHGASYATALVTKGDLLSMQGDYVKSFKYYEEAMMIRSQLWGAHSVRLAREQYDLAMGLIMSGRLEQGQRELERSLQTMAVALGGQHLNSGIVELQLGVVEWWVGLKLGGRARMQHAAQIILKHEGEVDERILMDVFKRVGEAALMEGRLTEARQYLQRAWSMQGRIKDGLSVSGRVEQAWAWYLEDVGAVEEALAVLTTARHEVVGSLGVAHPHIQSLNEAIGYAYFLKGDLAEARTWLEPRPARRLLDGNQVPAVMPTSAWTAYLLEEARYAEAEPLIQANYSTVLAMPRANQYLVSLFAAESQMARLRYGQRRYQDAKQHFERAIRLISGLYNGNPYQAEVRAHYGLCLIALHDFVDARAQADLAETILRREPHVANHFKRPLLELLGRLNSNERAQ